MDTTACMSECVSDTFSDAVLSTNLVDVALQTFWERLRTRIEDQILCTNLVFGGGRKSYCVKLCNQYLDAVLYANYSVLGCGCERDDCSVHKRRSMLILLQKDTNMV